MNNLIARVEFFFFKMGVEAGRRGRLHSFVLRLLSSGYKKGYDLGNISFWAYRRQAINYARGVK